MSEIDDLVDRAVQAVAAIARRGSTLTTGVAIVAAVIFGSAYLVGLAAFGGSTRTMWAVVGGAMLLAAVGAPLVASFRLRAIPRKTRGLVGELRTLLGRDESAKRIVIETVAAEPTFDSTGAAAGDAPGGASPGVHGGGRFGASRTPEVIGQFQRFSTLRSIAGAADVPTIASIARTIGSLPALVSIGILLTGVGAVLGFIFTLIWIF